MTPASEAEADLALVQSIALTGKQKKTGSVPSVSQSRKISA